MCTHTHVPHTQAPKIHTVPFGSLGTTPPPPMPWKKEKICLPLIFVEWVYCWSNCFWLTWSWSCYNNGAGLRGMSPLTWDLYVFTDPCASATCPNGGSCYSYAPGHAECSGQGKNKMFYGVLMHRCSSENPPSKVFQLISHKISWENMCDRDTHVQNITFHRAMNTLY